MSQKEVYEIIKELGGEATYSEIKRRAKEKFPNLTLWQYVTDRLKKLEKKGYVIKIKRGDEIVWKIVEEYP
uniref:Uncharacterized protein n=1 Tax=candidate division WOR-3 bacterium TaxID=2052148 RepID=A0A7V3KNY3_UNCW3